MHKCIQRKRASDLGTVTDKMTDPQNECQYTQTSLYLFWIYHVFIDGQNNSSSKQTCNDYSDNHNGNFSYNLKTEYNKYFQ